MADVLKNVSLRDAEKLVDEIDRIGGHQTRIEQNVRPLVIALIAHGFPTVASCEGHIGNTLYPWVLLTRYAGSMLLEDVVECLSSARAQMDALDDLLAEFYSDKWESFTQDRRLVTVADAWQPTDDDSKIIRDLEYGRSSFADPPRCPISLSYSLMCAGAELLGLMPREVLKAHEAQILERRQQDALEFAEFLISKL